MPDAGTVAREWIVALNAQNADRLVELAAPDVEFATPRGVQRGLEVLRSFVARQSYGTALWVEIDRVFVGPDVAVVSGRDEYRSTETGERMDASTSATVFRLRDGLVVRLSMHDRLEAALAEAGLDAEEHAVPE